MHVCVALFPLPAGNRKTRKTNSIFFWTSPEIQNSILSGKHNFFLTSLA